MTREEVLLKMTEASSQGTWAPIERYADLLAELERMLSDREMEVLVNAGARLVRLSYPDVFRVRQM
ncbi:hypothetical protein [Paraburkholderia gardini]|uniref:hypothetical protein n=1 Tax=Paraburkholderia gardini TaxID=2823469 RepID=UPI001D4EA5AA|nr:hypothetical protein [Paraburkholderia gardini]CAG4889495.1 hypothetical protein R69919_00757 [Paraburkholderia gardini]